VLVSVVQPVDRGEELAHVDLGRAVGVERIVLVLAERVADHLLDLAHRDVHRIRDAALEVELEGLTDVDQRPQSELARLQ
jgi:hypothetical protein